MGLYANLYRAGKSRLKKSPRHAELVSAPHQKVGDRKVDNIHVLDHASGNVLWDAEINSA
jgi:hypothetical protein